MIRRTNSSLDRIDFRREIKNPRNMRGGAIGGDVIRIGGDLNDTDVENELKVFLDARKVLFGRARTIIVNRVKYRMLQVFDGAAAIIYGIRFTYNSRSGEWRSAIDDATSFMGHILGIAETGKTLKELNNEWVKTLLNINNSEFFIVTGDLRPGIT